MEARAGCRGEAASRPYNPGRAQSEALGPRGDPNPLTEELRYAPPGGKEMRKRPTMDTRQQGNAKRGRALILLVRLNTQAWGQHWPTLRCCLENARPTGRRGDAAHRPRNRGTASALLKMLKTDGTNLRIS